MTNNAEIQRWLSKQSSLVFSLFAVVAAFSTYFSMYAFRKPFAAASYEGVAALSVFGLVVKYKTALITFQVFGYCTSKFLGIKIISEMRPEHRAMMILACIGVAWIALLGFALVPTPWNIVCLAINGLPLGMVWGLVFGFLEGRRVSEVLGVGLSASYILASGVVKGVGRALMNAGVPELWMPFATGACFAVPMGIFVFLLSCLPPPTPEDIAARTERVPMDGAARKAFFLKYLVGLLPLTLLYIVLTAYRDFRDNFAVEIWGSLGYGEDDVATMMAGSEVPVTVGVLLILALLMVIRDNRKALLTVHGIMLAGTAMVGVSTLLFELDVIGPAAWMITIGLGLYAAYVPFGCILFDRLIATVGAVGTAGFLIYVTDAFGYLGAVLLMLYKDIGSPDLSWKTFFIQASYGAAIFCTTLYVVSLAYFGRLTTKEAPASDPTS